MLAKSAGKEGKLFEKLVAKYGPEPAAEEPVAAADAADVAAAADEPGATAGEGGSKAKKKKDKAARKEEDEERKRQAADESRALLEKMRKKDPKAVLPVEAAADSSSEEEDDGYGTRDWWKARLVRFYKKYAPDKLEGVDGLLDKANNDPAQLDKLFRLLEKKYGPEPDPSSSSESEQEDEGAPAAAEEAPPLPVRVTYCPVDGVPPEYSEYFDTFAQALPWLAAHTPDLVLQTHKGATVAEYAKAQGVAPMAADEAADLADKARQRKRGGEGKKGDGRVIIECTERRKKDITVIEGLGQVPSIKLKEAAKALGKKFASGCAVKNAPSGEEIIEIQGDCAYDLPDVLTALYPELPKDKLFVRVDGKVRGAFE